MDSKDELRDLWCSQPIPAAKTKEELVKLVQEKARRFDRQIYWLKVRECVAGVLIALIFGYFALRAPNAMLRAGFILIALTGMWIIFFLLRYASASTPPDTGLDLDGYRNALVEKLDRQIWLLRSVKYWYLLPLWIGLVISNVGGLLFLTHHGGIAWYNYLAPAFYTAAFVFVWWLNESYGVGKLRGERERVLALAGDTAEDRN